MSFCLRIGVLLLLVTGTLTEDVPPTDKPQKQPKAPEKPISDGGLDLLDALGPDEPVKPKKPSSGDSGGFGFDLTDALGPDPNPKPEQPAVKPPSGGGGGGNFGDSDLFDIGGGEYKPDGGGGVDPGSDTHGGADQPQEAGSGKIAGIVSAVGVALLGAAASYFAYQKKKLCFKIQGGADPEKGHQGAQSDPQVFSNLLRTS
ncbi:CD99 molecule isoform X2 [Pseudoliparis swirei]|uniref:CD99 molecule isoform X2 n=1 Tax=Pseudoliparis swirei TaxID=2059687 RepID=UPI0024BEC315|nr:CD99 molecule isoform X2 [Pseudoliparis swirei]